MVTDLVLLTIAGVLALYAIFILVLLAIGRHTEARALAGFIPDCAVFFKRLLGDERVSGPRKLALLALLAYLASPVDLIPDFFPVAGQLDDAILVALVLRLLVRSGGPELIDQHWPGPPHGARLIERLAFGTQPGSRPSASS